jgi:sensor histidine kinase YesM
MRKRRSRTFAGNHGGRWAERRVAARRASAEPRRSLIPIEATIAFALASPLIAVLISKAVLFDFWTDGLHVLVLCVVTCTGVSLTLHAVFEGLVARLPLVQRRHPARVVVYLVVASMIATGVMWPAAYVMNLVSTATDWEPARRFAQAITVTLSYLALTRLFRRMTERIADERNRAVAERAAGLTARLQALQARTNPHFLFNTLNSVMSLIAKQPGEAEQMVRQLAKLTRYFLEGTDQTYVALGRELDAVRDYLGIEQVRFGDRLRIDIEVAADIDLEMRVPPMVLQPLAENAVLHGVSRRIHGGHVRVAVQRGADHCIDLAVTDDGADAGSSGHVGTQTSLANLKERLLLVYGGRAALTTSRSADGGFRAQVTLPASDAP